MLCTENNEANWALKYGETMTGWKRSIFMSPLQSGSRLTPFSRLIFSIELMFWFKPSVMFIRSINCTAILPCIHTRSPLRHSMATSFTLTFHNLILSWLTPRSIIIFHKPVITQDVKKSPRFCETLRVHYRVHKIRLLIHTWYHTKVSLHTSICFR